MSSLAPVAQSRTENLTSLTVSGGRDISPGNTRSWQNPDLWVKGGAIIDKSLSVSGNIGVDEYFIGNVISNLVVLSAIDEKFLGEGVDVYGDFRFHGNIIGGNIGGGEGPTGPAGGSLTGFYPNPLIATNAVGTNEIASGTITNIKLVNSTVGVAGSSGRITSSSPVVPLGSTTTLDLAPSGVTAGVYGSTSNSAVLNIDPYGRVTSATTAPIVVSASNGGTGVTATPTNGQILIGNGSGFSAATLTPGTAIAVTNGSGTITLNNIGVTGLLTTGSGISASASTGVVTLSNTGVTNVTAGLGIQTSGGTGNVTVTSSLPTALIWMSEGVQVSIPSNAFTPLEGYDQQMQNGSVFNVLAANGIIVPSGSGLLQVTINVTWVNPPAAQYTIRMFETYDAGNVNRQVGASDIKVLASSQTSMHQQLNLTVPWYTGTVVGQILVSVHHTNGSPVNIGSITSNNLFGRLGNSISVTKLS